MTPRIAVIILNWNGWVDTVECLESVYRSKYSNYDVIVVDNASRDDSIEKIKEYAKGKLKVSSKFFEYNPKNKPIKIFELTEEEALQGKFNKPLYEKYDPDRRLILIKNNKNYGYAEGNNKAIKFAIMTLNSNYVLILNNDTVIPPNFIETIIKDTLSKKCDLNSPFIMYYDSPLIIHNAGSVLIPIVGYHVKLCHNKQKTKGCLRVKPQFIEGSAILMRSEILLDIGLFDESFFCYWEEIDLEIRARKKEYSICVTPSINVWHKIAKSSGGSKSDFYIYYYTRNRIRIFRRYFKKFLAFHLIISLSAELIFRLIQLKSIKRLYVYLRALKNGLFNDDKQDSQLIYSKHQMHSKYAEEVLK